MKTSILELTDRIQQRSRTLRQAYLARLQRLAVGGKQLSCPTHEGRGNLLCNRREGRQAGRGEARR